MRNRRNILLIAVSALMIFCAGCERRPLNEIGKSLLLRLNIDLQIKNVDPLAITKPEVMRVIFYDPATESKITEDYLPFGGGLINISAGNYELLVYNFDTESVLIKNDSYFHHIEAYTNKINTTLRSSVLQTIKHSQETRAEEGEMSAEDQEWAEAMAALEASDIVYEPDHLWVARQPVTIYATAEGEQVIEASAETVVETYYISVRIKNKQYMASARALLTGQVRSNKIGYEKEEGKSEEDVTLYFDMGAGTDSDDNDVVWANFNTFGKLPNADSRLWLTILVTNSDGTTEEWHKDITDEFKDNDDKKIVIVEEIVVPEPPDNPSGGGFTPTVDDWEEENHEITI